MTAPRFGPEPAEDIPAFPLARNCPFAPPEPYERRRARTPVSRVRMLGGNDAWLVTRHEDVRRVLSDPRTSADRRAPGFPRFAPATEAQRRASFFRPPLNWQDPPEHTRTRPWLMRDFTARRAELMRPRIAEVVDACLEDMLSTGPPLDLVRHLADPVPSRVICGILGVPYDGHERFESAIAVMMDRTASAPRRGGAARDVRSLLEAVVADAARGRGTGLVARLVDEQGADDLDSVTSSAFVLLVAGQVTTSNMISLGTLALLEHPDQLARMTSDPERVPAAVEELLRYCSIVEAATARTATADTVVGGVTVRAGEGIVPVVQTANRDPDVFERPHELDIARPPRAHLAFGHGRHRCLGSALARVELQCVFEALFRRIPSLRAAVPLDRVAFRRESNIYGVRELPVTW
ncbi:hypothetical protein BJF83_09570 [Nocardiopsis sp. CNR-923]|uniref:cytochrome P450 n=1 Tax=Nocardiopsis sp. CNR-923 TaxID=1904965 RepID=UPI00095EB522|nr:cytochrome P450 [Nocardiopsis sp. CNR-923]OLT29941.1 hypothetical protein BJF83_09570 [Nocardiopsis sp. CNR-923]